MKSFRTGGIGLISTLLLLFPLSACGNGDASPQATPSAKSTAWTQAKYETYVGLFMKSDPGWKAYYAPDAVFELPGADGKTTLLHGVDQIEATFKPIHEIMTETSKIDWFVADQDSAAVKIESAFVVKKDAVYMGMKIKKGQTMQQTGVLYYLMENGKITRVESGGSSQSNGFK